MKKTNLNLVIIISLGLCVVFELSLAMGKPNFNFLATGLGIYFLLFLASRFYQLNGDQNSLTKFLLGNRKYPLYAVTATVVLLVFFKRTPHPVIDFTATYTALSLGVIAGVAGFLREVSAGRR